MVVLQIIADINLTKKLIEYKFWVVFLYCIRDFVDIIQLYVL